MEENLAADALQMIAQAASAAGEDDNDTANTGPTVRRRISVQGPPRAQASQIDPEEPKNHVRVCCLQIGQRQTTESLWSSAQRALSCLTSVALNENDVDLFVLPELSPLGPTQDTFAKYLPLSQEWQSIYQRIESAFSEQARALGVYIVYGTIGWHRRESDRSLKFTLQLSAELAFMEVCGLFWMQVGDSSLEIRYRIPHLIVFEGKLGQPVV